ADLNRQRGNRRKGKVGYQADLRDEAIRVPAIKALEGVHRGEISRVRFPRHVRIAKGVHRNVSGEVVTTAAEVGRVQQRRSVCLDPGDEGVGWPSPGRRLRSIRSRGKILRARFPHDVSASRTVDADGRSAIAAVAAEVRGPQQRLLAGSRGVE